LKSPFNLYNGTSTDSFYDTAVKKLHDENNLWKAENRYCLYLCSKMYRVYTVSLCTICIVVIPAFMYLRRPPKVNKNFCDFAELLSMNSLFHEIITAQKL